MGYRVPDLRAPGVVLRPLRDEDLPAYLEVWRANAAYLRTSQAEMSRSPEALAAEVVSADPLNPHLGIWRDLALVGRVDLVPVDAPTFSVGYWVSEAASGQGLATEALRLAVGHALRELGATDVYAGVLRDNEASARVLTKAGFVEVSDEGTYRRFHRPLDGGPPREPGAGR